LEIAPVASNSFDAEETQRDPSRCNRSNNAFVISGHNSFVAWKAQWRWAHRIEYASGFPNALWGGDSGRWCDYFSPKPWHAWCDTAI